MTVSCRRSPAASLESVSLESRVLWVGGCAVRGVAHWPQKTNPGGFSKPHCGQRRLSGVAHEPQNFIPSGLSNPQLGQRMLPLLGVSHGADVWTSHRDYP